MHRSTESWEALLEGATPGPWRWYWDNGIMSLDGADTMPVATNLHVYDSDLLAAAPEAVGEVVRLRRELEELATSLGRKAGRAQRNRAYSAAIGYRETAKKITNILNQEGTDE